MRFLRKMCYTIIAVNGGSAFRSGADRLFGGRTMARAYLKLWTKTGREGTVRDELLAIKGVTMADLTAGEQDIIAVVEADSYEDLLQIVVGQIRPLGGVERTVTNFAL